MGGVSGGCWASAVSGALVSMDIQTFLVFDGGDSCVKTGTLVFTA
jgi:hypothetical protein